MGTISPADSVAIVNAVSGAARPIALALLAHFEGLDPKVAEWLARAGAASLAVLVVSALRWGMVAAEAARPSNAVVVWWDRLRGVANPLLATVLGLGAGGGDVLVAALPVLMHALYRGTGKALGKTTPQGVARAARGAGAVALVAGVALALVAGPAMADGPRILRPLTRTDESLGGAFARQRWALTGALGAQASGWIYSRGKQGFVEGQVAYQWTNAIGLRVGVRRIAVAKAPLSPEAKLTFTWAP